MNDSLGLRLAICALVKMQKYVLWSMLIAVQLGLVVFMLPQDWTVALLDYQPSGWGRLPLGLAALVYVQSFLLFIAAPAFLGIILLRACLSFHFSAQYSLRTIILVQVAIFILVGLVFFGDEFTSFAGLYVGGVLVLIAGNWLCDSGHWLTICKKTGKLTCLPVQKRSLKKNRLSKKKPSPFGEGF